MDIKELIKWALQRWWWFAISVGVCALLGGIYFVCSTPKYKVNATLMLRQSNDKGGQSEMIQMMGFGDTKVAGDEITILTSRDLMGRVVDELNLCTTYFAKEGTRWKEQFPNHDVTVTMPVPSIKTVTVEIQVKDKGYDVKVKTGRFASERFYVTNFANPICSKEGEVVIAISDTIQEGRFMAVIKPRIWVIEGQLQSISVNRLNRESNIITLSTITKCPARSIATINTLLNFYNQESATDKNILAVQTEQFLAERIEVVEKELNEVEMSLESYKRTQQIADLSKTADNYQQLGDNYEQQVAQLDADLKVMDFIAQQVSKPENAYAIIPGNLGNDNANLNLLIQNYNVLIAKRATLLQSATEQNLVVVQTTELIDQQRLAIQDGITQARQKLDLRRQAVLDQQNQYSSRLASIPETERRFLEMSRDKQTKEKQYLYLIEKREENAMLLASEAVPAKIIDRAQRDPKIAQPKLKMVGAVSLLLGLFLPFLIYFIELFRKEYL